MMTDKQPRIYMLGVQPCMGCHVLLNIDTAELGWIRGDDGGLCVSGCGSVYEIIDDIPTKVVPALKCAIKKLKLKAAMLPNVARWQHDWIIDYAKEDLERMVTWVLYLRAWDKAARCIQQGWLAARLNPYHPWGRSRLLREYERLGRI